MKINNEVSYKDKCVFVRSKIKEVINDIRENVIPMYYAHLQFIRGGRVKIEGRSVAESVCDVRMSIYNLEFICDILKKWYDTISKNVDGEMIGSTITYPILFILCDDDCITTTVNSLYIFFNTFDVTQMKSKVSTFIVIYTDERAHKNNKYTLYTFLSLCQHYCDCNHKHNIFNRKIYCDNECKLLYYIWKLYICTTVDEAKNIYMQAIKP